MYDKVKAFFKKYKYIIISVASAIFAALGVNYFRNRAIKRNLQRINGELAESDRLIKQQQLENSKLARELEQSRAIVYELKQKLNDSKRTASELDAINGELESESSNIKRGLDKLKDLIDNSSSRE